MKFKNIFIYTQAISAITLICTSTSFAFDITLLANDKEAVTHAYKSRDLKRAQENLGTINDSNIVFYSYKALRDTLNELEKTNQVCDLVLIQKLKGKLEEVKIKNDRESISNLLVVWRSQNLIDDLFFEIVQQSNNLAESISTTSVNEIRNSEIKRSEKYIGYKKIDVAELSATYGNLSSFNTTNPGCSVDAWLDISRNFSFSIEKEKNIRALNIAAKSKNIISNETFNLAEILKENDVQSWDLTLSKYLDTLKGSKNKDRSANPKPTDLLPNELSSRLKYKRGLKSKRDNTTYRKSIYARFNSMQISMIADVLKKTFDRMDATKAEVVFTFKNGSEALPLAPMGQYFLARQHLRKDISDLGKSMYFAGVSVTHEDLISVGLETGLVTASMLDSALKIDDLWNPVVKPWKKIADYAFRVTGTATLFLPPPYNVVSSIALVFIEGQINKRSEQSNYGDSYDIF